MVALTKSKAIAPLSPSRFNGLGWCLALLVCLMSSCSSPEQQTADPEELFVHEVVPIFEAKCMGCHGNDPSKVEGGLDLSSYPNMLAGGHSGDPAVVAGSARQSRLYQSILRIDEDLAMPPKEGDKLSDIDVQIIKDWIDGGAPWPDDERIAEIKAQSADWQYANRIRVRTSGGLSETWDNRPYEQENLWAYYPLTQPEVPWGDMDPSKANPIDAFLEAKRAAMGLKPAPSTERGSLIRRATINLTGLPPTPEEVQSFLSDEDPQSFAKVVQRLLESPRYGEQWARYWLDVVRYADTGGFSNDFVRPNAWRYRDYVIRAFNEDKPYDQFVREQIAGDEIDPTDPEMLVATGFLRMGPWEHTGMSVAAETRQYYLDDVTNIVGEAFLSTPLNCAKCHDHKYDPIPAKDYYRIQAVFAATQFADREAPFLNEENTEVSDFERDRIVQWIEATREEQEAIRRKEEDAARAWFQERGRAYLPKRQRRQLPDDQQPPRFHGLSYEELGYRKILQKRLQLLNKEKQRMEPYAFSVYNGPDRVLHSMRNAPLPDNLEGAIPETFILDGGSVYAPSQPVEAGVMSILSFLAPTSEAPQRKIPQSLDNRRLAFAQWLTSPDHPITARSIVNRIWQYHFGQGIAQTPNNFGGTGGKPTHPELLDWLAHYFVDHGWSIKELHRLILSSKAYQMSSTHPQWEKVNEVDPNNQWLCYFKPRRMHAEELRDAMLCISGELNTTMGGVPARPEINLEAALQPRHTMGSTAPAYQPGRTPQERNRRSVYAERIRTLRDPDMDVFNQPMSDLSCEEREESTVSPQAFTLFNGKSVRDRSLAFADQLAKAYQDRESQVQRAIQAIYNREPHEGEIEAALDYLGKMTTYHQEHQPPAVEFPTEVEREMVEEMTGEPFSYVEELDIYEVYVPDLQPADVNASTRALGDLVAVYFNSNEFVYVY
ncbi:MAG: PSD1 and planctomycete cytochrome C domain-containing protein [Bacteroidota bacterium]